MKVSLLSERMERIEKLLADQKAEIAALTAQLADLKQASTQVQL